MLLISAVGLDRSPSPGWDTCSASLVAPLWSLSRFYWMPHKRLSFLRVRLRVIRRSIILNPSAKKVSHLTRYPTRSCSKTSKTHLIFRSLFLVNLNFFFSRFPLDWLMLNPWLLTASSWKNLSRLLKRQELGQEGPSKSWLIVKVNKFKTKNTLQESFLTFIIRNTFIIVNHQSIHLPKEKKNIFMYC